MALSDNELYYELEKLSKEELVQASLERRSSKKRPIGPYTRRAKIAQQLLWTRAGQPFQSSAHWKRGHTFRQKF